MDKALGLVEFVVIRATAARDPMLRTALKETSTQLSVVAARTTHAIGAHVARASLSTIQAVTYDSISHGVLPYIKKAVTHTVEALSIVEQESMAWVEDDDFEADDGTFRDEWIARYGWPMKRVSPNLVSHIRREFDSLHGMAIAKKWTDDTILPIESLSLHSVFDRDAIIGQGSIIQVASIIDTKLIEYFRKNPEKLYDLTPRQFEELIAALFDGFGYNIELTARTRDGGCDVIALKNNEVGSARYLIECKKFHRERKIDIGIVRALYGIVVSDGATKGILATTAYFSQPAQKLFQKHKYILEPRDFDRIVSWLNLYQRMRLARIAESVQDHSGKTPYTAL